MKTQPFPGFFQSGGVNVGQGHGGVEGRLAAQGGQQGLGALTGDDRGHRRGFRPGTGYRILR